MSNNEDKTLKKITLEVIRELSCLFNGNPVPLYLVLEELGSKDIDIEYDYTDFLDVMEEICESPNYTQTKCIIMED